GNTFYNLYFIYIIDDARFDYRFGRNRNNSTSGHKFPDFNAVRCNHQAHRFRGIKALDATKIREFNLYSAMGLSCLFIEQNAAPQTTNRRRAVRSVTRYTVHRIKSILLKGRQIVTPNNCSLSRLNGQRRFLPDSGCSSLLDIFFWLSKNY